MPVNPCCCRKKKYIPGPVDCPTDPAPEELLGSLPGTINPGGCPVQACVSEPTVTEILLYRSGSCTYAHRRLPPNPMADFCVGGVVFHFGTDQFEVWLDGNGTVAGDGYAAWIYDIYDQAPASNIRLRYLKKWTQNPEGPVGEYTLWAIEYNDNNEWKKCSGSPVADLYVYLSL